MEITSSIKKTIDNISKIDGISIEQNDDDNPYELNYKIELENVHIGLTVSEEKANSSIKIYSFRINVRIKKSTLKNNNESVLDDSINKFNDSSLLSVAIRKTNYEPVGNPPEDRLIISFKSYVLSKKEINEDELKTILDGLVMSPHVLVSQIGKIVNGDE